MVLGETGNNAYAKFWRDKQRVLLYFLYWLIQTELSFITVNVRDKKRY